MGLYEYPHKDMKHNFHFTLQQSSHALLKRLFLDSPKGTHPAVIEHIVTQSRRLVEFSVSKWLKLTHINLFTSLFD